MQGVCGRESSIELLSLHGRKGLAADSAMKQGNNMKTMKDYLKAVSEKWQCKSENDLAHLLGISRQALLQFRQGRTKYFKPRTVYRMAQLLNIEPEEMLISHQIICAENDAIKKTWEKVFTKITKHAACVAIVTAAVITASNTSNFSENIEYFWLCILCQILLILLLRFFGMKTARQSFSWKR